MFLAAPHRSGSSVGQFARHISRQPGFECLAQHGDRKPALARQIEIIAAGGPDRRYQHAGPAGAVKHRLDLGRRHSDEIASLVLAATLAMLHGANTLAPALDPARAGGPAGRDRLERLRRRAVRLDALVLAAIAGLIIAVAFRPPPTTAGIIEPTPRQRADRAFEASRQRQAERLESLPARPVTPPSGTPDARP